MDKIHIDDSFTASVSDDGSLPRRHQVSRLSLFKKKERRSKFRCDIVMEKLNQKVKKGELEPICINTGDTGVPHLNESDIEY